MDDASVEPGYLVVIQCRRVVGQNCSGFKCESAFAARRGGFARHPADRRIRYLPISCGGCPGGSVGARLARVRRGLAARGEIGDTVLAVHLATCMTHVRPGGAMCPHAESIAAQVARAGIPCFSGTHGAEKERKA